MPTNIIGSVWTPKNGRLENQTNKHKGTLNKYTKSIKKFSVNVYFFSTILATRTAKTNSKSSNLFLLNQKIHG